MVRFLPADVPEHVSVSPEESLVDKEGKSFARSKVCHRSVCIVLHAVYVSQAEQKRVSFEWLPVALDGYALAAVAVDPPQIDYASTMAHKAVCLGIAAAAPREGRTGFLSVCYDEPAR